MKALIVLLCTVVVATNCQDASVIVIGSKFIRPKQQYTAAFANPLTSNVKLKLSLYCDGDNAFRKDSALQLNRQSGKSISIAVPEIANVTDNQCYFSAVNDGGKVEVNYEIDLLAPKKTLSMFILTDKPIYKPGDELRFRVVVVDIALKPAKHIESIEIEIEDIDGKSKRLWSHAKLHNGIFESSYQMPSVPDPGMWTISAKANDNGVENEKSHQFEVREYVLPKFVVKVAPTRILLISEKEVSLNVASHYTFGEPVQGKIRVELFTNPKLPRFTHSDDRRFDSSAQFSFKLKDELLPEDGEDHFMVTVNVSVTEKFSNFTTTVTKKIPVFQHPYKIAVIKPSMYFRPGAKYFCKLSVKDHNGFPVEPQGRSITLKTDTGDDDLEGELNNQGIASFVLSMPDAEENVTISAEFEGVDYDNIEVVEGLNTYPSQYLQVYTKNRIIAGRSATFTVNSNEPIGQLSYFIASRGNIVWGGYQKISNKRKSFSLKVKLSQEMAPHARLLVYTLNNGQLIMDFFELYFENFNNEFEYMLDEETYRPDQDFYVDISAEKDSYVAFQAIDQGALLLGYEEFGLTKEHVLRDLEKYVAEDDNDIDLIHSFGLFLRFGKEDSVSGGANRMRRSVQRSRRRTYVKPIFLRIDFPESWLWKNFTMNNKPTHSLSELVPGTITSWYVTGFALSPSKGLGLMSAPKRFTVGKPFYMIANLPYSIKRGEVTVIQVTLFNFLGTSLTTDVTLFNKNDEIDFVDKTSTDTKRRKKAIVVPTHQAESISFMIRAKKLGEIAIKIEAFNELANDGLEHMLRVIPESRLKQKTESRFINLPKYDNQSYDIICDIAREADPGSTKIFAIIDPPFIASTANSLDALLASPTGGADLNLMTFIPNIVVLDYLLETETAATDIEQKALDYLSSGYQNQLKYKDSNGAFSQWNPPKDKPSVFLTALVANAITTASKHITVSEEVITDAFTWISEKQKSNGCFKEDGEIIYPPMQDSSSSSALTAFVVAAFKGNEKFASQFSAVVDKGIKCLADNFYSLRNTHDIAVATYALSLANHPNSKQYLDRLIRDSEYDLTNGRYWREEQDVEIASYALLAYIAQNKYLDAIPIMKWLNQQRYSIGEFAGVQSTFVALKALGKMAVQLDTKKNDYRVRIKYGQHILSFDIEGQKALRSTKHDLPENERRFTFDFEGIGFGLFQLTWQYHLSIQIPKHHRFDLNVKVLDTSSFDVQNLQVCLKYKAPEAYKFTGTTLVEVYLPSGMEFNDNAVTDTSNRTKNTERAFGNTAMFVYYSALADKVEVCFRVTAYRKFKIAMQRPAYVVVYDTNNKEHFAIKQYEGKVLQVCDICDADDCKSMNC